MWGNPGDAPGLASVGGSIPSYVGEPSDHRARAMMPWEHPLVCGGTGWVSLRYSDPYGASPRMWGNPSDAGNPVPLGGSIPSYVGEPLSKPPSWPKLKEHPLVCGGTTWKQSRLFGAHGASPRMWGNRNARDPQVDRIRSIPSYVGEPRLALLYLRPIPEHPLVCGGTAAVNGPKAWKTGASPRMWGNPLGRDMLYPFLTLLWTLSGCAGGRPLSCGWLEWPGQCSGAGCSLRRSRQRWLRRRTFCAGTLLGRGGWPSPSGRSSRTWCWSSGLAPG